MENWWTTFSFFTFFFLFSIWEPHTYSLVPDCARLSKDLFLHTHVYIFNFLAVSCLFTFRFSSFVVEYFIQHSPEMQKQNGLELGQSNVVYRIKIRLKHDSISKRLSVTPWVFIDSTCKHWMQLSDWEIRVAKKSSK